MSNSKKQAKSNLEKNALKALKEAARDARKMATFYGTKLIVTNQSIKPLVGKKPITKGKS